MSSNPFDPSTYRPNFGGQGGGATTGQGMAPSPGGNPYMAQQGGQIDSRGGNNPFGGSNVGGQPTAPSWQDIFSGQANGGDFRSGNIGAGFNYAPQQQNHYQPQQAPQGQQQGGNNVDPAQRPSWWNQGEAGAPGTPDFVRHPQTQQDWEQRYGYMQQHPESTSQNAPINAWYQQNDPRARAQLQQLAGNTSGQTYNGMNAQGARNQLFQWGDTSAMGQGAKLEPGGPGYTSGRYHMPDGSIIDAGTGQHVGFDPRSGGGQPGGGGISRPGGGGGGGMGGGNNGGGGGGGYAPQGGGGGGGIAQTPQNQARLQHLVANYGSQQGLSLFKAENQPGAANEWGLGNPNLPPTVGPSYDQMYPNSAPTQNTPWLAGGGSSGTPYPSIGQSYDQMMQGSNNSATTAIGNSLRGLGNLSNSSFGPLSPVPQFIPSAQPPQYGPSTPVPSFLPQAGSYNGNPDNGYYSY